MTASTNGYVDPQAVHCNCDPDDLIHAAPAVAKGVAAVGAAIPFTSAATPPVDSGRGTLEALCVTGESSDPNTLRIDPGAKLGLKLAPFATPVIAGVALEPVPDAATLTATGALLVAL